MATDYTYRKLTKDTGCQSNEHLDVKIPAAENACSASTGVGETAATIWL
jgi:hypothetical protein